MQLAEVLARRRMIRSFDDRPIPPELLESILDAALRAPSAGFAQGVDFVVLEGAEQTGGFWEATTSARWRREGPWHEGLMRAPVILLPVPDAAAYLARYAEADKAASGLQDEAAWRVPYWTVDAAFSTMLVLLRAVDLGLGALFFRIFTGEEELMRNLGAPGGRRPIGAVALGFPTEDAATSSSSVARGRRPRGEVVHRGRW